MENLKDLPKTLLESSFFKDAADDPLILIIIFGTLISVSLAILLKVAFINMNKADAKKLTEFKENLEK